MILEFSYQKLLWVVFLANGEHAREREWFQRVYTVSATRFKSRL